MIKTSRADGGLAMAASGLRAAREMSISSRRNVRVTFGTNTIMNDARRVLRGSPARRRPTLVRTTTLEGRAEFRPPTGVARHA